jgi:hypothetical protein
VHPRIINERTRQATTRLTAAANVLAEQDGVPTITVDTTAPVARGNSEANRMLELEAIAAFLERLAIRRVTGPSGDALFDALKPADWSTLTQAGLGSIDRMALASDHDLDAVPGVGEKKRAAIRETIQAMYDSGQLAVLLATTGHEDLGDPGDDYDFVDGVYVDHREPAATDAERVIDHSGQFGGRGEENPAAALEAERQARAAAMEESLNRLAAQAEAQNQPPAEDPQTETQDQPPAEDPQTETEPAGDAPPVEDPELPAEDAPAGPDAADAVDAAPGDTTVTAPEGAAPGPDATAPAGAAPGPAATAPSNTKRSRTGKSSTTRARR